MPPKVCIQSIVVIPKGKVALGKLAQACMYGAKIIEIDGNFDDALNIVRKISENTPIALVNSVNPYRIEGQKTAAFEIVDQLGQAPRLLMYSCRERGEYYSLLERLQRI